MVDNVHGATADDSEIGRVRRDLLDIREQFAAASEVLVSLGQSSSSNDAVLDTLVSSVCRLCRGDAAMVFLAEGASYRLGQSIGLSDEYVRFIGEHPVSADRRIIGSPMSRRSPNAFASFSTIIAAPAAANARCPTRSRSRIWPPT